MVQTAKSKNTNTSSDEITQEKYNNVVRQLKRERRKIRKINRQRFNNEIRKAAEESVNGSLQNKINKLKDHILELEEDYDIKRYNDRADFKNAICKIATYAFSVCGIWVLRELYFASSCDCEQWE
jgi:hypothetical protein